MAKDEASALDASDLDVGIRATFERQISSEDVSAFAELSGDQNPLHTDESYAAQTNYGRRIVHGAFQIGLASTMVGMHLPGRNAVVGSMRSRFPSPLFFPSEVAVQGEITAWLPQAGNGTVRVRVIERSQSVLTAEIHVGFGLHEARVTPSSEAATWAPRESDLPIVVLTGATSSIGPDLLRRLTAAYHVLAVVRSRPPELPEDSGVETVQCDLSGESWEEALDRALGGRPVYGLVHAAWPGAPQGGLMTLDLETIESQVRFGTLTTIRLARWLARHARGAGRMVVLGTTAATLEPSLQLAAYSLGKAAMQQTVRLVAPELAGKGISINAVLPSFMPQGMNRTKTRHIVLSETAAVPLGRLCTPDDVAASIEYLLSDAGSFIAGQLLPLTGGRL